MICYVLLHALLQKKKPSNITKFLHAMITGASQLDYSLGVDEPQSYESVRRGFIFNNRWVSRAPYYTFHYIRANLGHKHTGGHVC